MLRCPTCQSTAIYRTPTASTWALLRRRLTTKRPHRCHDCGWQGWGEETGPKFTPEQIASASLALTQPLDLAHDVGMLEVPKESDVFDPSYSARSRS